MTLRLSASAQLKKTELLSDALEKLIVARAQIDAVNASIEAAHETAGDAIKDYATALAKLEQFARQTAVEQSAKFGKQSLSWKRSDAGRRAAEWIGFYMNYKPQTPNIELPTPMGVDVFNDDLLSAFEESLICHEARCYLIRQLLWTGW